MIELIHGDCMDVMKTMPDNWAGLKNLLQFENEKPMDEHEKNPLKKKGVDS